jgi:S1/P1 Nuclease
MSTIMFKGRSTNLHQVWDTGVLANAGTKDERAFALSLARSISPAEAEKWRSGTPAGWADDRYGVAINLIYGVWPHGPGDVPASYEGDLCRRRAARESRGKAGRGAEYGIAVRR